jgi:hypothetical protein
VARLLERIRRRLISLVKKPPPPPGPFAEYRDLSPRVYTALPVHAARYSECLGAQDLSPYEFRVFSQNGEDGVIAEILLRIGVTSRWFVEFGIGTGHEGNCVLLADAYGWNGLFCEPDDVTFPKLEFKYSTNPRIRTDQTVVTPENIADVFARNGVHEEMDVLSIDVDTIDYWIWEALEGYRPRLVIVEYNSMLSMDRALVYPKDQNPRWDETAFYGSSLGAFRHLADRKGYQLVHTEMFGVNAFFVRQDLADRVGVETPPMRTSNFWLSGGHMPPDPQQRSWTELPTGGLPD